MARYPRSYGRNVGMERALQHIREGEQLSRELGGTDVDVKEYFFSLSPSQLRPILDEYGRRNGQRARTYAEQTIPAWRSGRRKMSGQNASRLFQLLPRYMPLEKKYTLVDSLWQKFAPTSEYSVSFGRNADSRAIAEVVRKHLNATVNEHTIPENLQRRFTWLADGDSQVMQQLLNHILMRDRQQAIEVSDAITNLLLGFARSGDAIQGFRRVLKVGGHTIHVFLDPQATEVKLSRGKPRYATTAPDYSWVWVVVSIAIVILIILSSRPH